MAKNRRKPPTLSDEALDLLAARFRVLAHPARLRLLNALLGGERSVGDLAEETDLEQPSVSRHLAALRSEGILARRIDGKRCYYRVDDPSLAKLLQVVCGGLADRLSGDLDSLPNAKVWRGAGI